MKKEVNKKRVIRKPMKYKRLFRVTSIILIISTFIFLLSLFKINVLKVKLLSILLVGIIVSEWLIVFVLNKRFKVGFKIPFFIMAILLSGVFSFASYNVAFASSLIDRIVGSVVREDRYELYVLKSSGYESAQDLKGLAIGIYESKNDTLTEATKLLRDKTSCKSDVLYDDVEAMMSAGIEGDLSGFLVNSSLSELLKDEYDELYKEYVLLDEYVITGEVERTNSSDVEVTKEPFLVYISGIDTYGSIGTVSRSDVNILMAVNPNTNEILLVNTPRDYYVMLHSKKAMDKLTHAGIYGVEESMNTLSDLYDAKVDYYFKVNFSSLIKIVDTLGGVTVDSKYAFSYDGYTFHVGENNLDGRAALAFSRCRKELPFGDVSRGENQQAVLKSLIEKVTSPSIVSKYMSILNTLSESFVTNMSEEDIYDLARMQINDNPKWTVDVQNASGHDASKTTYSAGKTLLYVMEQDEESVEEVKNKLKSILGK